MMLCHRCQYQATCLLPQLGNHDQSIQARLDQLQTCEMYLVKFPQGVACDDVLPTLLAAGQAWLAGVSDTGRHWLKAVLQHTCLRHKAVDHLGS